MLTVIWCRSECCVRSRFNFEAAGGSFYVIACPIICCLRTLSRCKHDMGALSCETLKRVPTPSLADLQGAPPMGPFHETAVLASLKMFYKHCVLGVSTGMTVTK